ncbi:MAG: hypothetical protein WCP69_15205, partial [Bacteroidota bacterium]
YGSVRGLGVKIPLTYSIFVSIYAIVALCGWRRASSFAIFVFWDLIANVLDLVGCFVYYELSTTMEYLSDTIEELLVTV